MTNKEIISKIEFKEIEISNNNKELKELKNLLIENALYKIGEKVIYKDEQFLIFSIEIMFKNRIAYNLTSPKKDGTMPKSILNSRYFIRHTELNNA